MRLKEENRQEKILDKIESLPRKYLENIDKQRESVANQDEALRLMEDAVSSGNLSFFSRDNFANYLGRFGEGLRTSKGVQLTSNQKEFLISNIGRAGPRPNQWIEQQISQALTRTGRTREANLTIVEGLKSRIARDKKRIELTDELEEKYLKELGYVPGNIASQVSSAMKPYEREIENRLSYRLRQLYEQENAGSLDKLVNKKVPYGTPLTAEMLSVFLRKYNDDPDKVRKNVKKLGYIIPSKEEYQRYINE